MSQMDSGMTSLGRTTSPLGGAVGKLSHLEIQQIKQPKMHCGDCNSDDCQWASINRGVYLCDQCAIIHREMGRHYSQVSDNHIECSNQGRKMDCENCDNCDCEKTQFRK